MQNLKFTNRNISVVIDIDNTIVDTAIRKQLLLEKKEIFTSIDDVRKDFNLTNVLKNKTIAFHKAFFLELDSVEVIENYEAPLFEGVSNTLQWLRERGYKIIFLSSRPSRLYNATLDELNKNSVFDVGDSLIMAPNDLDLDEIEGFKKAQLLTLLNYCDIVAVIGDRPSDVRASQAADIPTILYNTTCTVNERIELKKVDRVGLSFCSNWHEILIAIERCEKGSRQLAELRSSFTADYSTFLSSLDNKCSLVITISAVISAISGSSLVNVASEYAKTRQLFLVPLIFGAALPLVLASLALLFAIRSYTSRRTSGQTITHPISLKVRQWFGFLLGYQKWIAIKGDALSDYQQARVTSSEVNQTRLHYQFFYSRYGTLDPDALLNLRLLEMRAANYSKVYPERIASKLLIYCVLSLCMWVFLYVLIVIISPVESAPVQNFIFPAMIQ